MKRRLEFDVLRTIAMVFIITYHFGCKYAEEGLPFFNLFYLTPNYDFGNIAVTIFLVLSGGLLYNRYGLISNANKTSNGDILRGGCKPNRTTLKEFYLKRAKVIYPPFWITCLYIPLSIVRHLLTDGNAFSTAHPLTLFLSVIGFDGYAKLFGISTYAFCGDWFIGAIVLLYLLYPLLAIAYQRFPIWTIFILVVLYSLQFSIPRDYYVILSALPVTIVLKFCIGFALVDNLERLKNWKIAFFALIIFLFISFVNIEGILNTDCFGTIAGIALFILVVNLSPMFNHSKTTAKVITKLAELSYCVFLVQHVIIVWGQMAFIKIFNIMHWNFTEWNVTILLVCTSVAIMAVAWVLKQVSDGLVKKISAL